MGTEFDLVIAAGDLKHPILSDNLLIDSFHHNRSTFAKLHEMITADSALHRVDEDWTDPANPAEIGISPDRIAEYRRLLVQVGCNRGFAAYPARPGIYFFSGTSGLSIAGSTKGYCYLEIAPNLVVSNTATYVPSDNSDSYRIYRPIEAHWYVYFERD